MFLFSRTTLPVLTLLTAVAACDIKRAPTDTGSDPLARIVVSPESVALDAQQTQAFKAQGLTAAGDTVPATVTWSASGGTITAGGMYTADASINDATVTATVSGGQLNALGQVKKRRVVQVIISPKNVTVPAGGTQQFAAYGRRNTGDSVSVAVTYAATGGTVGGSGAFTAGQTAGAYRVIATQNAGALADTSAVTVATVPVASVTVSPASASVQTGLTVQLTATPKDANGTALSGRVVNWTTSDAGVATVSGSGLVTGVAAGSATIRATSEGQSGTASVTVTAAPPPPPPPPGPPGTVGDLRVASVTDSSVTLAFTEVTDGTGAPAKYDIRWAAGTLSWSSATDVARGSCTVPMAGTAIGAARSCTVLGLAAGTGFQFQLLAFRGTLNVDAVFGGSSNIASGTTSVSTAPVASVTVSPASASVGIAQTVQLTATPKDANGNPLTGRVVTWASSNPLVASVTSSGLVTGLVAGTATITATSEGQNGTATVTVTVLPPPPPAGWTHEPSGFSAVEDQGWESGSLGNWTLYYQTADKPITVVPITDSPLGESRAFQIGYLAGHVGGGGTEARFEIPAAYQRNEIFVGYYVQVNSLWQGHNSGINKMVFLADGGASGFSAMWYEMFGSGSSPLGLYVVNQTGGSPGGTHENVNPVNFTRGAWHKVEIYQKQGQPGIVRVWVDDVLAIDRSDMYTRAAPLDAVAISGIWGGVGDAKTQFDFMRFDRIHISVR